jgi:hypothetical protein
MFPPQLKLSLQRHWLLLELFCLLFTTVLGKDASFAWCFQSPVAAFLEAPRTDVIALGSLALLVSAALEPTPVVRTFVRDRSAHPGVYRLA